MPSLRAAVASVIIPGIVLLNCACLCSISAATQTPGVASSLHTHCSGGDASSGSRQHGAPTDHGSSPGCPHCNHVQVSAALAGDSGNSLLTAPLLTSALAPHSAVGTPALAATARPHAVVHSPPAQALLRQKCVLLI